MSMNHAKQIVKELFGMRELQDAHKIIQECKEKGRQPKKKFVNPRLETIEAKAGQPMDASYVAYLIEYYFLDESCEVQT